MKKSTVKALLKYGLTTLVGGLMAWAVIQLHGLFEATQDVERIRILADAFTIPGVVITLFGVLVFLSNEGAFEGISYVMRYAINMLIPGRGADRHQKFGDYVEERRAKGKITGFGFLFLVGGVFLLAAVVLTIVFFRMS